MNLTNQEDIAGFFNLSTKSDSTSITDIRQIDRDIPLPVLDIIVLYIYHLRWPFFSSSSSSSSHSVQYMYYFFLFD